MIPILLIAGNFVRENRWPVLLLLTWLLLSALAFGVLEDHPALADILFYLKQQAFYGIAFSGFLSAAAIHNERKSRRILGVLSKGITRGQYVAGLLLGVFTGAAGYCAAIGGAGSWIARKGGLQLDQLWWVVALVMAACVVAATMAMFFSTFLNPFLATAAAAFLIGGPIMAGMYSSAGWLRLMPVYALAESLLRFSFQRDWEPGWSYVGIAALHAIGFWLASTLVFGRRDIAVAVE